MKKAVAHDAYEVLAEGYDRLNDVKEYNAFYDRPAVQSLVPDVAGLKVLDAGCGVGAYTKWLVDKGSEVTGIDASSKMLEFARKRVGDCVELIEANMEEPLDFFEGEIFDGIVAGLSVAYVEDLYVLFKELGRVLKSGGWFVFSTEHPMFAREYFKIENYFKVQRVECDWHGFGTVVRIPGYFHSLGTISDALTENGFAIDKILEPKPIEEFKKYDPEGYEKLMKRPAFICFRGRKL